MPLTVVSSRTDSGLLMASPGQNLAKTPENPEIHEIPGALEMATGKGAGIAKDNFAAFVKFNPFRRPWKPEIQEIQGALEMASGKGAGIAKSTSLMLSVSAALEAGKIRNTSEKERVLQIRRPSISAALEVGNPGYPSGLGNCVRKRSGCCKIDKIGAFVVFPHFGGLGSRKSKKYSGLGNGNR